MAALWALLACSNGRGGGDIPDGVAYEFRDDPPRVVEVVSDPEYRQLAQECIGRWAGDRIAVVGDYTEDGDLPPRFRASRIYRDCLEGRNGWRDISDAVLPIVERACGVRVEREEGWRHKRLLGTGESASHFAPDAVFGPPPRRAEAD